MERTYPSVIAYVGSACYTCCIGMNNILPPLIDRSINDQLYKYTFPRLIIRGHSLISTIFRVNKNFNYKVIKSNCYIKFSLLMQLKY